MQMCSLNTSKDNAFKICASKEDEMVGWHHRFNGHVFEQTPEDGEGQGTLVCCCPRGRKELDVT